MKADAAVTQKHLPPEGTPPHILPATERKSTKINVWDFTKNFIMIALVTKVAFWAGYGAMRFSPSSWLPKSWRALQVVEENGIKAYPLGILVGSVTGAIGAYYEGWKRWKKIKETQLGVKDIHKDIYTELDPKILEKEVGQNQRIQDGIASLVSRHAFKPRGSFTEAALQESAEASPAPAR